MIAATDASHGDLVAIIFNYSNITFTRLYKTAEYCSRDSTYGLMSSSNIYTATGIN